MCNIITLYAVVIIHAIVKNNAHRHISVVYIRLYDVIIIIIIITVIIITHPRSSDTRSSML